MLKEIDYKNDVNAKPPYSYAALICLGTIHILCNHLGGGGERVKLFPKVLKSSQKFPKGPKGSQKVPKGSKRSQNVSRMSQKCIYVIYGCPLSYERHQKENDP